MSENFTFECVSCKTELEVPIEYCGFQAECTECSATFVLPTLEEVEAAGSVHEVSNDDGEMAETGTVKIDRASIGMIPDVADQFKLDFGTMNTEPKLDLPKNDMKKGPSRTNGSSKSKKSKKFSKQPKSSRSSRPKTPPKPKKKWWQFWK